jgi:hypothetical protein
MAIKGKSKSRGARTVARGPKPAYVPVKRPLFQRKGFWYGVGVVVLGILGLGLAYGFVHQHDQDQAAAEARARATAVRRFGSQVDPILTGIGSAVPPSSYHVFTSLSQDLSDLASGKLPADQAATNATGVTTQAKQAAAAIAGIDAVSMVRDKGFEEGFVLYVLNAKAELASALRLYQQVGDLMTLAATGPEDARAAVIGRAQELLKLADEAFTRGYDAYVQAQSAAGTFQPQAPPPPGLPGSTGATGIASTTGASGSGATGGSR